MATNYTCDICGKSCAKELKIYTGTKLEFKTVAKDQMELLDFFRIIPGNDTDNSQVSMIKNKNICFECFLKATGLKDTKFHTIEIRNNLIAKVKELKALMSSTKTGFAIIYDGPIDNITDEMLVSLISVFRAQIDMELKYLLDKYKINGYPLDEIGHPFRIDIEDVRAHVNNIYDTMSREDQQRYFELLSKK